KQNGADFDALRDPWGNPYDIRFRTQAAYSQKFIVTSTETNDQRVSTPVTVVSREVSVYSPGLDKIANTKDDFEIARYSVLVSEEKASDSNPQQTTNSPVLNGNTGALRGVVTDPTGAVVAGATVTAIREGSNVEYKDKTNGDGKF